MKRLFLTLWLALAAVSPVGYGVVAPMAVPVARAAEECVKVSVPLPGTSNEICGEQTRGGVIMTYVRAIIRFMGSLVGLVIIMMIIIGGVQYLTAAGNPSQVAAAKSRIQNAITGLFLFIFMYAILNYLVPGGIIG